MTQEDYFQQFAGFGLNQMGEVGKAEVIHDIERFRRGELVRISPQQIGKSQLFAVSSFDDWRYQNCVPPSHLRIIELPLPVWELVE